MEQSLHYGGPEKGSRNSVLHRSFHIYKLCLLFTDAFDDIFNLNSVDKRKKEIFFHSQSLSVCVCFDYFTSIIRGFIDFRYINKYFPN